MVAALVCDPRGGPGPRPRLLRRPFQRSRSQTWSVWT